MALQRRGGLQGPQGLQGPPGPQGPVGPIGPPGTGGGGPTLTVVVNTATTWTPVFASGDATVASTSITNTSDTGIWVAFTDEPWDDDGEGIYLAPGSGTFARVYSGPLTALHVGPSGTKQLSASRF